MMDNGMNVMMGGLMLLWVLLLIALIALAVVGAVWLMRDMRRPDEESSVSPHSAAGAELDRRYVSGELPHEDYLQRRSDLEG